MPPTDAEVVQTVPAAKPNPRNNVTMFKIFQNVQHNVVQHKKYVKEMIKLYKKLDEETFRESFKNALLYLFTFGDTSANVDRVVQYVASFCTALDDEEEFLLFIFDIIFECQCVSGQSVRYRASQLLAAVLSALGEDASLDDDLCDKLLASQLQRMQDTRGAVRCRAALALQRLQNPPDDEVTRAYRFHMCCDPSSSVRRAVLMSIAKTRHNVPFVLERLCDVDESVRRAAFLYISAMPVTQLKVTQRILTLKVGLTERSPRVRRVVEEILIPGWLSTLKGNIVDLLKAIRLDNAQDAKDSEYVAGKLLDSLFKRLPVSELLEWLPTDRQLRVIPAEKLNKETAWYWRHLAEHLHTIEDDETLETVLPDLVVLTKYIRIIVEAPCPSPDNAVEFSTRQLVLHELASMLRVYDVTDPAGRAALHTLITDTLTGDYGPLTPPVIRAFVSALSLVVPEVSPRTALVAGMVSALRDAPDEPDPAPPAPAPPSLDHQKLKLERARLRVSLNVAIESQEEAVRDQNYALAAECKEKVENIQKKLEELSAAAAPVEAPPQPIPTIKEKVSDSETLNKCLIILNAALDSPQVKSITPMLQMIFNELEVEIFQNPDLLENALQTVALYGMLDKEFAKENKAFFFTNLIETSNEPIVSTVLKCCVDLLCVHGARVFEEEPETSKRMSKADDGTMSESIMSSPDHSTVIEILLKIMDSSCATYRLIIVEGLCRLLHLSHLESASILSRLLLLWFNPATVDEDNLRQIIGIFFQTFPTCVDSAQEQIQKATIPTLRALANAPSSSPLAEIDQEAVVRFIVSLTRVNLELTDSQGAMAMVLSHYVSSRPSAPEVGLVCRTLALLSPPRDARLAADLAVLLRAAAEVTTVYSIDTLLTTCPPLVCRTLALLSPPRDARLAADLAVLLRAAAEKLPDKQSSRNLTRYLGALEATERASLNKMSNTGLTDGTLQTEETLTTIGRATTSLPQPLARSTHVVINETVEEEPEIDETSPTDAVSNIEPVVDTAEPTASSPQSARSSSDSVPDVDVPSDSSGVSPVKKPKRAKKKKSPVKKQPSDTKKVEKVKLTKEKEKEKKAEEKGGVKRSRSQRSLVDVERAQKAKAEAAKAEAAKAEAAKAEAAKAKHTPPKDLDVSNVTIRKSTRGASMAEAAATTKKAKKGGKKEKANNAKPTTRGSIDSMRSSRSSTGSRDSMFDNSADETELHTIVYDKEFEQEILNDSSELADSKLSSKGNVTIPETPDASEESEPEPEPVKAKGKSKAKKK